MIFGEKRKKYEVVKVRFFMELRAQWRAIFIIAAHKGEREAFAATKASQLTTQWLHLLEQILPHKHLHQLIPINFADFGSSAVVVGDIGGILGQKVADDLINGIVAFFSQCLVYITKNAPHIFGVVVNDGELLGG